MKSRITIDVYNIFFTVTIHDPKLKNILKPLLESLTTYKLVYNKIYRRMFRELDKEYFVRYNNHYRFTINNLKTCMRVLGSQGMTRDDLQIIQRSIHRSNKLDVIFNPNITPRKDQMLYVKEVTKANTTPLSLIDLRTGGGKASSVDSLVRIPNGWKRMGDIEVGDSVIAKDGATTKVTNVYPQGKLDLYRITFYDGRTHEACGEHLWKVYSSYFKDNYRVINTNELLARMSASDSSEYEYYIDLPDPELNTNKVFKIHPYTFGCSLGDGKLVQDKFIPEEYLNGSAEQRYELLKGLMDTNGYISKTGTIYYYAISELLANNVVELIRSLGGIVIIGNKVPYYIHNGIKKSGIVSYRLTIIMKNNISCATRPDLLARLKSNQHSVELRLRINSIEYIGKKEAQCISIEHKDKLYVAGDYVVTHNTLISMYSFTKLNKTLGIVIIPKYLGKWKDDIKKYTNATDDDIYVVVGTTSLVKLLESNVYYKFVIFSTRTLMNYINSYIKNPDNGYLPPYLIMEKLRLGNILSDETHQDFYSVFIISLFLNANKYICLSATLYSKKPDINRIYKTMFPDNYRVSNLVIHEPYLHVYAVRYELYSLRGIHYMTPNGYSHTLLEQSIMRNNLLLRSYINMILYYIKDGYISRKKDGQRMLIFAATIRMCTILTNYIKKVYSNLDIRRYVEDDDYSNILEADICISTVQSSGTAIDISGLITVLQTVSMKSIQANLQTSGRLREIEGTDVRYYYLYAGNIDKQKDYHLERKVDLAAKTKEWHDLRYNTVLKT